MAAVLAASHGAQSSHVRRSRQQALRGETSWRGGGPPPPPCAPSTGAQQQPVRDLGQSGAPQPQQQPQQQPQVDRPPFLVVVEGRNDMQAVRRALPAADVFVLGTSTAADSPTVLKQLATAAPRYRSGLLLLLDPDVAGRQARLTLDERLQGCLHAFLPSPLATARMATRHHAEGNVGVEHAPPAAILAALAHPRRSDPQRRMFDRAQLLRWGLVAELHARGGNVTRRRGLVCAFLGLGECDGKQLLRQLNRFGFTMADVERALAWAECQGVGRGSGGNECG